MASKGIMIYVLGHPHYLAMAINLAASIRYNSNDVAIAAVTSANLTADTAASGLFNSVIELDKKVYTVNNKIVFNHAMMQLYDMTPFDHTIKLDADMIWLPGKSIDELFEIDAPVVLENTGHGWNKGNSVWAKEEEIKKAYKVNEDEHRLYKIFGEFVLFKQCAEAERYFKKVREIYFKPKVKCAAFSNGTMTDELAYQIACMKTGTYPPENIVPVFNIFLKRNKDSFLHIPELAKKYFALSIGGNKIPERLKANYNNLASFYSKAFGLQSSFKATDKKNFLKERAKL